MAVVELVAWATYERKVQTTLAREAGLTASRSFHEGIVAVCAMIEGDKAAAAMLAKVVEQRGARGTRGIDGIRTGLAMVAGAQSLLDAAGEETAADWREDGGKSETGQ